MVESLKITLTRREQYNVMYDLEKVEPFTSEDDLEDVTELVFKALGHLKDCEFLAKADFDLNETMSAYEAMDVKMDMRLKKNEGPNPIELIKKDILVTDRPLKEEELLALLDEFFIQMATWQGQNVQLQQTVYSC